MKVVRLDSAGLPVPVPSDTRYPPACLFPPTDRYLAMADTPPVGGGSVMTTIKRHVTQGGTKSPGQLQSR